jgi:hypothetical protein
MADLAAFLPHPVPVSYHGLWQRTFLERDASSTLTSDRDERVFWLQTAHWHADLRIPLDRPDFSGVTLIEACDDRQLAFIADQDAFCGITKVDGPICTWLRFHDLRPGTALDVGRMAFRSPDLLVETGVGETYLEHWERVEGSGGSTATSTGRDGVLMLQAGRFSMRVRPRGPAPLDLDAYLPADAPRPRAHLLWLASLEISLVADGRTVLSTHPWLEDRTTAIGSELAACA